MGFSDIFKTSNIQSNYLLTAVDIDNNDKTINYQIEKLTLKFIEDRIKNELKLIKATHKSENQENFLLNQQKVLSKIELEEIQQNLYNKFLHDELSESYRTQQKQILTNNKDNYNAVRKIIHEMNEMNEFSAEIERQSFQTIDGFLKVNELIDKCSKYSNFLEIVVNSRKKSIQEYLTYVKNLETASLSIQEILKNIQQLYDVTKDIDDFVLYDMFELEDNLSMSNKLSDLVIKSNTNPINDLVNKDHKNIINNLVKQQIISNQLLSILLLTNYTTERTSFISNNSVTTFDTMWLNSETNPYIYATRTLGELLFEITNPVYSNLEKSKRQQIYLTYDGTRPKNNEYYKWNGLQVFDIDLKEWINPLNNLNGNVDLLKRKLFELLSEFHWFLWIVKSASGKGIHIYTKVTPPHHIYINPPDNEYITNYWYHVNYLHKSAIIYDALYQINRDDGKIKFNDKDFIQDGSNNSGFELKFLDNVVGRITSGIRLTYDPLPLVNHNFLDLQIIFGLTQTLNGDNSLINLNRTLFRDTLINQKLLNIINTELCVDNITDYISKLSDKHQQVDLSKFITLGLDIDMINPIPKNQINYITRYNVCNTLASLFGKDGLQIAHTILSSTECKNVQEINAFYSCALSNKKEPSKIGLDILKKHGIIKQISPDLKQHTDNIFKNGIRQAIELNCQNDEKEFDIALNEGEYLSNYTEQLQELIVSEKINCVWSPAGSGKTEFIKRLSKSGKRIMLVLPFISVIKNKIIYDQEIMDDFDVYFGAADTKKLEYNRNSVMTFDKFSRSNFEKISKMYEYIFIDESHLLFTSSYRIEATSAAIRKLKNLFFISQNDPFSAKICMFTGTITGENFYFGKDLNLIQVSKKMLEKTMEFMICDDTLDCITTLSFLTSKLINDGYRIIIPTNKGEIYSEKLIGMVTYLLGRSPKYGYYKRSNTEQEICRLINEVGTVGPYEIVFCSDYLSVGVDINDGSANQAQSVKFASIYFGIFSGYEIEQFNSRIRKTGIKSYYCVQTQNSNGEINHLLLEEPNLLLKLTDDDITNFQDDKIIAGAKQEFIAEYDPILRKIITPGFSYLNGKIDFDLENYELTNFETKYKECMVHPVKIARELSKYNYDITVNTDYEGMSISQQEELKKIGLESARNEKIRKHTLLVGTYLDLIKNNRFSNDNGLEFNNVIDWILSNMSDVIEDREMIPDSEGNNGYVKVNFDMFATPQSCIVKSRESLESMIRQARYIISKYSLHNAINLINNYLDDNGILKKKNFQRAINLLKLVDSADANELAGPLASTLEQMYEFIDSFEISNTYSISQQVYQSTIEHWTNTYIDNLGIKINTAYGYEKIRDSLLEMLADISNRNTTKSGIRFTYNKLPDADSTNILNKRSIDSIIEKMFQITAEAIQSNRKKTGNVRDKHIILTQQAF
jgi:hypothetical protein